MYTNHKSCALTKVLCFSKYEPYMLHSIVAKSLLQVYYVFSLTKIVEFWGKIYNCQSLLAPTPLLGGKSRANFSKVQFWSVSINLLIGTVCKQCSLFPARNTLLWYGKILICYGFGKYFFVWLAVGCGVCFFLCLGLLVGCLGFFSFFSFFLNGAELFFK